MEERVRERRATRRARANDDHASGPREKTLAGVGHENADADHGKECCNYLDHRNGPLRSAETKRYRRPNSQKNSASRTRVPMQLMISGNRECQKGGGPLAQPASRRQHPGGKPISAIALEFLWGGGRRALRCQPTGGLAWNVLSPPRGAPASLLTPGARELGFHAMAGQTLAIADDGRSDWIVRRRKDGTAEITIDHEDVSRSRLRVNSRRWLLSKVPPCLYGDRPEEFSGAVRRLVGIEVGVVSGVFNLESPGVGAPGMETTP